MRNQTEDTDAYIQEMEQKPDMTSVFAASRTSADIEFEKLSKAAGYVKKEGETLKRPLEEEKVETEEEDEDDIIAFIRRKEEKRRQMFASPLKKLKEAHEKMKDEDRKVVLSSEDEDEEEVVMGSEKKSSSGFVDMTENDVSDSELAQISDNVMIDQTENQVEDVDYSTAGGFFVDSDDEKQQTLVKNSRKKQTKPENPDIETTDSVRNNGDSVRKSLEIESDDDVAEILTQVSEHSSAKNDIDTKMNVEASQTVQPKLTQQEKRKAILEELKAKKAKLTESNVSEEPEMIEPSSTCKETVGFEESIGNGKLRQDNAAKDSDEPDKDNVATQNTLDKTECSQNEPVTDCNIPVAQETGRRESSDPSNPNSNSVSPVPKQTPKKDVKKDILAELKAKLQEEKAKLAIQAQENAALEKELKTDETVLQQNSSGFGNGRQDLGNVTESEVVKEVEGTEKEQEVRDEETGESRTQNQG